MKIFIKKTHAIELEVRLEEIYFTNTATNKSIIIIISILTSFEKNLVESKLKLQIEMKMKAFKFTSVSYLLNELFSEVKLMQKKFPGTKFLEMVLKFLF